MGSPPPAPTVRLAPSPTERIDRARILPFTWSGRPLAGLAGDTVASALWHQGVRVLARSFEAHRPRGLYDLEGEGASQLVSIDGVPNRSAGTEWLASGMEVTAQNVRGDPRRDPWEILDRLDRWMPAGFYYRRFHRPRRAWPFFQNRMRALAGLGRLDPGRPPPSRRRAERWMNVDVAVVGGGPSGMAAALAAADAGLRVCLFERRPWLGGHLDWRAEGAEGGAGDAPFLLARAMADRIGEHDAIRCFTDAPATGIWGENLLTGFQRKRGVDTLHWECRARAIVVATGALERPLVFEHNDRPGILQADTAWRLARTWAVAPGRVAAFSVADDLALEAARDLVRLGIGVAAVADARSGGHDPAAVGALEAAGVEFLPGWAATAATGRPSVRGVELRPCRGPGARRFACDVLIASAGRQPDPGVLSTAGARFDYDTRAAAFLPSELPPGVFAAGALTGRLDPAAREASGHLAGLEAARFCGAGVEAPLRAARDRLGALGGPPPGCGVLRGPGVRGRKAFLDFDEDGTWENARQCVEQGFDRPELAKRFGNFGLGPGQYRVPGQNLAMAMAELTGRPLDGIRATTVRPPVIPVELGTLAGPRHDVHKQTPLHDEQAARGATFRRAGAWQRARRFGEDPACRDEIRNVRTRVGILDSSPLGKFRLFGPDAMKALQRVYISDMTRVRARRCKYSAMLNETGNLVDDGVVVRVGDDDFYLTSSSARAGRTVEWFRFHTRHEGWDYHLVDLTDALASMNLAGPNARAVLERVTRADVSNEAFPYLGYREIEIGEGVPARCLRLGFVGELSYELHVPASYGEYVWNLLFAAGADFGIRPFGLEAQFCLRAEKGHVIIGAETEQRVTLLDLGMGWLWDREDTASGKVGAPALRLCERQTGRLVLVGLRFGASAGVAPAGADDPMPADGALVIEGDRVAGFVCTARYSETLGHAFGLALVRDDLARDRHVLDLYEDAGHGARRWKAIVQPPRFYDPDGERVRS